jgi:hypothetical protein
MGACWKDSGEECDFDITTDVTRYILFQLPDSSKGNNPTDDPSRCGPRSHQLAYCPLSHTYRNGTTVRLGDPGFPYRAYHSVSPALQRKDATTIALGATPPPPPFRCKHDCWSNPQEQDWVRAEPSPEWAEYGFPSSPTDALTAKSWTLDVGGITSVLAKLFSGKQPAVMKWHTLNVGPEIMANPGETAVWELADFDVLA